ncbi:putative NBD/HSP70 family sugar kinase [Arthrobacter sp. ES3-54]|nr:putative NBD/HSP70 family sugar kinase [Arthrobacter sp. ES3-54]
MNRTGFDAASFFVKDSDYAQDTDHSVLAVATVDITHSRVAVTDLAGAVLAEESLDVTITDGPERVLKSLAAAFDRLLEGTGNSRDQLSGVGLSVPGPVDPHSGRLSQPPIMPGWDAYPVIEHLQDSLPVPVFVENDADAMAFGEYSAAAPSCEAHCLVKVSTGIGTGLVINGSVYHGIDGGAGDIGHTRLEGVDALCQCGSRGCLAASAARCPRVREGLCFSCQVLGSLVILHPDQTRRVRGCFSVSLHHES